MSRRFERTIGALPPSARSIWRTSGAELAIAVGVRCLFIAVLLAPAATARAGDHDVETYFGAGLGPVDIGGDLGHHVHASLGGGVAFGLRHRWLGVEFTYGGSNIELDDATLEQPGRIAIVPSVAFYPVVLPWFELSLHAGFGFASINSSRSTVVACDPREECNGGVKMADLDVHYPGDVLATGARVQFQFGHDVQHFMLWTDYTVALVEHQIGAQVIGGIVTQLTFGVGIAID